MTIRFLLLRWLLTFECSWLQLPAAEAICTSYKFHMFYVLVDILHTTCSLEPLDQDILWRKFSMGSRSRISNLESLLAMAGMVLKSTNSESWGTVLVLLGVPCYPSSSYGVVLYSFFKKEKWHSALRTRDSGAGPILSFFMPTLYIREYSRNLGLKKIPKTP